MKIGLVGPSNQERSLPFDAQRTINLYPVFDQSGKEVSALYGTPGLVEFSNAGGGPIRGEFAAANGRAFAVSGNALYEISSNGTPTSRGTLDTSSGIISVDENGFQLGICDGSAVYILTYATNSFVKVNDADLVNPSTITFIDSYFVANKANSGQFNLSGQFDGLTWPTLSFATAESSPDDLLRVFNAVGQLWLFGTKTTEIWTNTGASTFPFERISGAKMETGILAPHTAVAVDNSVFWIGRDSYGSGIVYRARGFTPQRVSTDAIERLIQAAPEPTTLRAYSYQEDGHTFYVITGGGMDTTLVYDISTSQWHERAYLNAYGEYEQHLGSCYMFAFGYRLVGSRVNGKIYRMSLDLYDDDGDELSSERIYTHLSDEGKRIRYNQLEIYMETGVGLNTGQGSDPQITLWISKDGGRTWSNGYTTSFGRMGEYGRRAEFRRLGIATQILFKIRITDPVKRSLIGSYLS